MINNPEVEQESTYKKEASFFTHNGNSLLGNE